MCVYVRCKVTVCVCVYVVTKGYRMLSVPFPVACNTVASSYCVQLDSVNEISGHTLFRVSSGWKAGSFFLAPLFLSHVAKCSTCTWGLYLSIVVSLSPTSWRKP